MFYSSLNLIAASFSNGELRIYNNVGFHIEHVKTFKEEESFIQKFVIDEQGQKLMMAFSNNIIRVFDIEERKNSDEMILKSFTNKINHGFNEINALDFNPENKNIIFFSGIFYQNDYRLVVWDCSKSQKLNEIKNIYENILFGFFGNTGHVIYICDKSNSFMSWDWEKNFISTINEFDHKIQKCFKDENRKKFFVTTSKNMIFLYNLSCPGRESLVSNSIYENSLEIFSFSFKENIVIYRFENNLILKSFDEKFIKKIELKNKEIKDGYHDVHYDGNSITLIDNKFDVYKFFRWSSTKNIQHQR